MYINGLFVQNKTRNSLGQFKRSRERYIHISTRAPHTKGFGFTYRKPVFRAD